MCRWQLIIKMFMVVIVVMVVTCHMVSSAPQLLTVYPEDNSLALVYRDKETLKFVKHINESSSSRLAAHESSKGFHDFSFVYYE